MTETDSGEALFTLCGLGLAFEQQPIFIKIEHGT